MAVDPSARMGVMRTSRVEEAPNPGPWPQATPVAEVNNGWQQLRQYDASDGVGEFSARIWYWPYGITFTELLKKNLSA